MTYLDLFLQYFILAFAIGIGWKWSNRVEERAAERSYATYMAGKKKVSEYINNEDEPDHPLKPKG